MTTITHNPYTGQPRDSRDIASDPDGKLIVAPGAEVLAADDFLLGKACVMSTVARHHVTV